MNGSQSHARALLALLSALSAGCFTTVCGDKVIDPGEACDDGNDIEGDGCDSNCTLSACQNGVAAPGELCFAEQRIVSPGSPSRVVVVDLNLDGRDDLLTAEQDFAATYLSGPGGPSLLRILPTQSPLQIAAGDLSGDGLPEALVLSAFTDTLDAYLNNASSPFGFATSSILDPGLSTGQVQALAAGRFGGSQGLLVGTVNGELALLTPQPEGNLGAVALFSLGGAITDALTVELDAADGDEAAVAVTSPAGGALILVVGGAPALQLGALSGLVGLAAADFDSDGLTDLAAVDTAGVVQALINGPNLSFQPAQPAEVPRGAFALTAADLDGDGRGDLAVLEPDGGLAALLGEGDGTFRAPRAVEVSAALSDLAAGDFNGDGAADLIGVDVDGALVMLLSEP